ncbi:sulfite reductase beta subunit [Purpureocillium lilacinum]|uniref:Sulfite reductase beta subunit n=1 Tax=Purpureocillium lilacinum TaxID=33203 RepID=A0A179HJF8_PURLI|nr:sulfite reductase beta subunit [Purpureocillium lilacinum]KAK4083244.1 hypothetical protein Purlil1_10814 [Purpureocillium lilacinum]OAQ88069.1 sulfite reductase beta subunit [Purpureocillium lilacinum]OAQ90124.1 sulfite reductase beta subunit [Purpureocillium lilacinum]PWI66881.1 hypothetical protein PCL_04725 [Purpureocillium lilacinum]GJN76541.1 hypothetical protein PLIIFM63780_000025 [Purpureocillium lilacinum]
MAAAAAHKADEAKMDLDDVDVDDTTTADSDPITASYQVFLNPALPLGRRLLVLQHPNRTDDAPRPPPTEMRVKAHSGMVEVDMPLDTGVAYDREKGLKWGRTLNASMATKNGGSHGLAGGFGFGAVQQRGPGRKKGDAAGADDDDQFLDWNDAVRQDKVLRTQTLGGQYPDTNEVQYMVGVFQGKDLHLTPVSSLVHLRPQLHHIDATTQQERNASASASKDAGAGGASSTAARAIHMTIKAAGDGDAVTTETMADRLRYVQSEPWRKMRYTDENEEAAWEVYNESLFLTAKGGDGQPTAADKGKDAQTQQSHLEDAVPRFGAKWADKQLLEAVSGIVKPDAPEPEPEAPVVKAEPKGKQSELAPRGRVTGGGSASAAAPRRGGRAKASTSRTTVNID